MARRLALLLVLAGVAAACGGGAVPASTSPGVTPGAIGSGSLTVDGAWARRAAKGMGSAAYFTIVNGGAGDDALVGVSTPVGEAQLHETSTDAGGMTGMHPVASLPVPAGARVALDPGGYHVMLEHLGQDLVAGATFPLTLTFEKLGPVTVDVEVRP